MSAILTASAAGSAIGGFFSNQAAGQQANAANNATQAQLGMFNTTQQNLQPYMGAGTTALSQLMGGIGPGGSLMPQSYTPYGMSQFQNSPEYQLMAQQNTNAMDASQNASSLHGGMNSNNMKNLINWTQGNTLQGYNTGLNNYMQQFLTGNQAKAQQFNTLAGVTSMGQNAAANLGGFSTQVGGQIGGNIIGAGNAQAAGTIGVGNAITSNANQGYQAYLQQQYLNNPNLNGTIMSAPNGGYGGSTGNYGAGGNYWGPSPP